ncbi:MAG: hypothetical protein LBD24_04025 [Spirochaetaceae bacterium]|nr:hypothetical protein [Spirochaetaceae bacterium]
MQNVLQSHEIKFGNAFEELFEKYFELYGYTHISKKIVYEKDSLAIDQLFRHSDGHICFIEQKMRDDHDSTKKRGQIDNFQKKIKALLEVYKERNMRCYFYFIDDSLTKNKNYYYESIEKIQADYTVYAKLCYGKELWEEIGHPELWAELKAHLECWKKEYISKGLSINFDEYPENAFDEIKRVKIEVFYKLFDNKEICKEILPVIFPQNKVLRLLHNYFSQKAGENRMYETVAGRIGEIIHQ